MKQLTMLFFAILYVGSSFATHFENGMVIKQPHSITLKQLVEAPVANAGIDADAIEGETVVLNGAFSFDPDSESLTYQWMAPQGITLSNATIANPSFIAPYVSNDTTYTFSLVVNDGSMDSNIDHVSISVKRLNKVPIANAGIDVEGYEGDSIYLDGSLSYDPEGTALNYIWTTLEGITLSASERSKITFTIPKYLRDTILVISLVVNDGLHYSQEDQFSITVWHINIAPVADAGKNRLVDEGIITTLDGSLSYDPEKRPLLFQWSAPHGIILSSVTDPRPTFTAPEVSKDTVYCFTLLVNDGMADSEAAQVKITVRQVNKAPEANAGIDFWVNEGMLATLDGSQSSDADGDPIKYKWSAPDEIILSSATDPRPSFTAPEVSKDTVYCFTLEVNDGMANSEAVQVKITVRQVNKLPIANAMLYQAANEGEIVTLDGSLSSDADGDSLIYKWMAPKGIVLNSKEYVHPSFIAPEVYIDTAYTFILVVNDGMVDSPPLTVRVFVKNVIKSTFFKVYPNPSTGIVTVNYCRTPDKEAQAIISTISGNEIMRNAISERSQFQVDLSGNASGVYILTILDNDNRYNQLIILREE